MAFPLDGACASLAHSVTHLAESSHRNESVELRVPPILRSILGLVNEEHVSLVAMESIWV